MAQIDDLRGALAAARRRTARPLRPHRRAAVLRQAIEPHTATAQLAGAAQPRHRRRAAHAAAPRPPHDLEPADLVVIVGTGELGPCGTGRTRFELELDGVDSPGVVAELAWLCGLVRYEREGYRGRWIDAPRSDAVPRGRSRRALRRRGRRSASACARSRSTATSTPDGHTVLAPVTSSGRSRSTVDSEHEARSYLAAKSAGTATAGPRHAQRPDPRRRGSSRSTRRVAGQLPDGPRPRALRRPARHGGHRRPHGARQPRLHRRGLRRAGLDPEELLGDVHPALVANTQGAGMGGMASLRRLLLDHLLDGERQTDRLQESLGNVVAAHAVQAYRRLLRPDGPPGRRVRDRRGFARGGARQDPSPARRSRCSPAASTTSRPKA